MILSFSFIGKIYVWRFFHFPFSKNILKLTNWWFLDIFFGECICYLTHWRLFFFFLRNTYRRLFFFFLRNTYRRFFNFIFLKIVSNQANLWFNFCYFHLNLLVINIMGGVKYLFNIWLTQWILLRLTI